MLAQDGLTIFAIALLPGLILATLTRRIGISAAVSALVPTLALVAAGLYYDSRYPYGDMKGIGMVLALFTIPISLPVEAIVGAATCLISEKFARRR